MPKRSRTFAAGVIILAAANLLVKIFGLFYKIPLVNLLGDSGMGYFNAAYTLYTLFYTVTTAGLPAAFSILIARELASGRENGAKRLLFRGLAFFSISGFLCTAFLILAAEPLAHLIGNAAAADGIRAIAPVLFFSCIGSVLRGFFQGSKDMAPSAVSQVLEAAGKLLAGLLLALLAVEKGEPLPLVAAYALLGVTVSSILSTVSLFISLILRQGRKKSIKRLPARTLSRDASLKDQILSILKISLPITISSSVMSITGLLDLTTVLHRLQDFGLSLEEANFLYGNYTGLAVPLFHLPPVLIYPLASTLLPYISGCLARGDTRGAAAYTEQALKHTFLLGIPSSVGLAALSQPILQLLFPLESARIAAPLLTVLAPACLFVGLLSVSGAILQAYGHPHLPIVSMLIGGALKITVGSYLIARFGIVGAPIGTLLCYLTATAVNSIFLIQKTAHPPKLLGYLLKISLSTFACITAALFALHLLPADHRSSTLLAIGIAVIVYGVLVVLFKAISRADLPNFTPKDQISYDENRFTKPPTGRSVAGNTNTV